MTAQDGVVSLSIMTSLASEDKSLHGLTLLWNLKELTHRCVACFYLSLGREQGREALGQGNRILVRLRKYIRDLWHSTVVKGVMPHS